MDSHVSAEQLSLFLDGELSLTAREAVRGHLESCPACAERHDSLVATVSALRLQPAQLWSDEQAERIALVVATDATRELGLPVAVTLAAAAAALAATRPAFLQAAYGVVASLFAALGRVSGGLVGSVSGSTLIALLVVGIVGPVLSIRLSRWR